MARASSSLDGQSMSRATCAVSQVAPQPKACTRVVSTARRSAVTVTRVRGNHGEVECCDDASTGPRALCRSVPPSLALRHAGRESRWPAACSFGPLMRLYLAWLLIALCSAGSWSAPLAAQSSSAGDAPKPEAVLLNGAAPIPANGSFL